MPVFTSGAPVFQTLSMITTRPPRYGERKSTEYREVTERQFLSTPMATTMFVNEYMHDLRKNALKILTSSAKSIRADRARAVLVIELAEQRPEWLGRHEQRVIKRWLDRRLFGDILYAKVIQLLKNGHQRWFYGVPEAEMKKWVGHDLIYNMPDPKHIHPMMEWMKDNSWDYNFKILWFQNLEQNYAQMPNACDLESFRREGLLPDFQFFLTDDTMYYPVEFVEYINSVSPVPFRMNEGIDGVTKEKLGNQWFLAHQRRNVSQR